MNVQEIKNLFADANVESINLAELVIDAGTQMRDKMNKNAIENYAHAMSEGRAKEFPEILVVALNHSVSMPDGSLLEDGALVLVDGFHRTEAAHSAKLATFQAKVVSADLETAKLFAMTANSEHGAQMSGKDYQKSIRELYSLNASWREHGKGKEMAALFGCSTKTVERALKVVKAEIKAQAFKMFSEGATDEQVAEFAVMHVKTAAEWRKEWEAATAKAEAKDSAGSDTGSDKQEETKDSKNPMDLSFAEVLRLKDSALKAQLLKMLMDSIKEDSAKQEEPQPEPEQEEEPQQEEKEPENVQGDSMEDLAKEWAAKDCWELFGKTHAQFQAMKNPKSALKRAYSKLLIKCHSDKYGKDNAALKVLTEAFAKASKYFK